jgi:hypothetical protein
MDRTRNHFCAADAREVPLPAQVEETFLSYEARKRRRPLMAACLSAGSGRLSSSELKRIEKEVFVSKQRFKAGVF